MPTIEEIEKRKKTEERIKKLGLSKRLEDIKQAKLAKVGVDAPLGSKEATEQLLAKGQELLTPTNLKGGDMDEIAPPIDTGAGLIDATANGITKSTAQIIEDAQKTAQERFDEQTKAFQDSQKERQKGLLDIFKSFAVKREEITEPKIEDITRDVLAEQGLTPESQLKIQNLMGQLQTFQTQQVTLEAQKQADLQELGPMRATQLRGHGARIEKAYNIKIAAKAAEAAIVSQQIQLQRGLHADARATTALIVDAATYDQQQALADIEWQKDTYMDLYNIMSSEEQKDWDRAHTLAKEELTRVTKEKTDINNLMLDSRGEAGITMSDTMEEATNKFNEWQRKEVAKPKPEEATATKKLYDEAVAAGYTKTFPEFLRERGILEVPVEGIEGLTPKQKDALAILLADIPTHTSREDALTDLETNKTVIMLQVGQVGYNTYLAEVDRIFPSTTPVTPEEKGEPSIITPELGGTPAMPGFVWTEEGTMVRTEEYPAYLKGKTEPGIVITGDEAEKTTSWFWNLFK